MIIIIIIIIIMNSWEIKFVMMMIILSSCPLHIGTAYCVPGPDAPWNNLMYACARNVVVPLDRVAPETIIVVTVSVATHSHTSTANSFYNNKHTVDRRDRRTRGSVDSQWSHVVRLGDCVRFLRFLVIDVYYHNNNSSKSCFVLLI